MKDWWLAIMIAGFLNVSLVTLMCSLRTNVATTNIPLQVMLIIRQTSCCL